MTKAITDFIAKEEFRRIFEKTIEELIVWNPFRILELKVLMRPSETQLLVAFMRNLGDGKFVVALVFVLSKLKL